MGKRGCFVVVALRQRSDLWQMTVSGLSQLIELKPYPRAFVAILMSL
jgi:hypothetical protein